MDDRLPGNLILNCCQQAMALTEIVGGRLNQNWGPMDRSLPVGGYSLFPESPTPTVTNSPEKLPLTKVGQGNSLFLLFFPQKTTE
jgi:hypothetical protein